MGDRSSSSAFDRARFGLEAAFLGLTPPLGAGPVPDAFVADHPDAGIVRAAQELIAADAEAREVSDDSVTEPAAEPEAADEADPPEGFTERLDLSWESPFVDYIEAETEASSPDVESDEDVGSEADDGSNR